MLDYIKKRAGKFAIAIVVVWFMLTNFNFTESFSSLFKQAEINQAIFIKKANDIKINGENQENVGTQLKIENQFNTQSGNTAASYQLTKIGDKTPISIFMTIQCWFIDCSSKKEK